MTVLVWALNLYPKLEKFLMLVSKIINFGGFFKLSLLLCKASGKYELSLNSSTFVAVVWYPNWCHLVPLYRQEFSHQFFTYLFVPVM